MSAMSIGLRNECDERYECGDTLIIGVIYINTTIENSVVTL